MRKGIGFFLGVLLMLALAGQATASVEFDLDNVLKPGENLLDSSNSYFTKTQMGPLSGIFDFTYVGSEAGNWNLAFQSTESNAIANVVFSNQDGMGATVSNAGDKVFGLDITKLNFWEVSFANPSYKLNTWSDAVHIYQLNDAVIINNVSLAAGMFLFAFNDSGTVDGDFDDMIIAAKPVPIPGAALLLGSALLGVVGIRRTRTV